MAGFSAYRFVPVRLFCSEQSGHDRAQKERRQPACKLTFTCFDNRKQRHVTCGNTQNGRNEKTFALNSLNETDA
jgi:hypothetical protein